MKQRFLAILYKVRFYRRYSRSQGGDVYFREKNRARWKFMCMGVVSRPLAE